MLRSPLRPRNLPALRRQLRTFHSPSESVVKTTGLGQGPRWIVAWLLVVSAVSANGSMATAQNAIFDNLIVKEESVSGLRGDSGDLFAQQFLLGDHTTITQVAVEMSGVGSPLGPITLELWNDSGLGDPGVAIAVISSLDEQIPFSQTTLTFDINITGLTANEPHYVVLSFENAVADFANHTVDWSMVGSDAGTFAASPAMVLGDFFEGDPRPREWLPAADDFVGTGLEGAMNYFVMRVVTSPDIEVLLGDYNNNGEVDAPDFNVWRDSFGDVGDSLPADGNRNGIVDAPDFTLWRDNFGNVEAVAVPEPVAGIPLAVAICFVPRLPARRRSSTARSSASRARLCRVRTESSVAPQS